MSFNFLPIPISVTILSKNSSKYLTQVLSALKPFEEVILYDNGSSDDTLAIASLFPNVKIHQGDFFGFGKTHNMATDLAKNDWILSVDSDEILPPELVEEIAQLPLKKNQRCYAIARDNYFNGKLIRWCGWHPDWQVRLYNRQVTAFSLDQVHEGVITKNLEISQLKKPLIHYSYETTADFLAKMQQYSTLFAIQNQGKKNSSVFKALSHALFAFIKSYFLKRGIFGGYEGFFISFYNANTTFYKYIKLREYNSKLIK